jgi:hypothetical protein
MMTRRWLLITTLIVVILLWSPAPVEAFAFEERAPSGRPISWPFCATIRYHLDLDHAPLNTVRVLSGALTTLHQATGLRFVADPHGSTTLAWVGPRELFGRTGVNAVTQDHINQGYQIDGASIRFNTSLATTFATHSTFARNLVLHELGHVLGLASVNNPSQIMNEWLAPNSTVSEYGRGDLSGLHELYPKACHP